MVWSRKACAALDLCMCDLCMCDLCMCDLCMCDLWHWPLAAEAVLVWQPVIQSLITVPAGGPRQLATTLPQLSGSSPCCCLH